MNAYPHDVWREFEHDPRHPTYAGIRASDADRDIVHRVLSEAYARGRLSKEEHDERSDYVSRVRTLGDLPSVLTDLVVVNQPPPPPAAPTVQPASNQAHGTLSGPPPPPPGVHPQQVRAAAERLVQAQLRRQWTGVVIAVGLSLFLMSLTGLVSIVIPGILTAVLAYRAARSQSRRGELVRQEQQQLEWRVADRLQRRQRGDFW